MRKKIITFYFPFQNSIIFSTVNIFLSYKFILHYNNRSIVITTKANIFLFCYA